MRIKVHSADCASANGKPCNCTPKVKTLVASAEEDFAAAAKYADGVVAQGPIDWAAKIYKGEDVFSPGDVTRNLARCYAALRQRLADAEAEKARLRGMMNSQTDQPTSRVPEREAAERRLASAVAFASDPRIADLIRYKNPGHTIGGQELAWCREVVAALAAAGT